MLLSKLLISLFATALSFASSSPPKKVEVNLRIEGATKTLYEGPIRTYGHNISTFSGGTHHCDGTNNGANPSPGPTCTTALADASGLVHFSFDGTYDSEFDDFFITRIGPDAETATQFWGLLLDYQFTPVGGCQQEVLKGQHVLWAFDAFEKSHFLKATGPEIVVKGKSATYTVVDGQTGSPVAGASIGGATTDQNGKAIVTFHSAGLKELKATESSSIRSNLVTTIVI